MATAEPCSVPSPSRRSRARRRSGAGLLLALLALVAVLASPSSVAAQEAPPELDAPAVTTLAAAMSGETRGVSASARGGYGVDEFVVTLDLSNPTGSAAALEVAPGTVLATSEEAQQALVVAGARANLVSEGGSGDTTVLVPPGRSQIELVAYCGQQLDVGPSVPTPVHHAGVALDPLPTVMTNILEAEELDPVVAQDAVWWVTDDPVVPVSPALRPLLEGVDTTAFAAEPTQVVADTAYTPLWAGGSQAVADRSPLPDVSAGGPPLVVWLVVMVLIAAVVGVLIRRSGRAPVQPLEVRSGAVAAGWYPDPRGVAPLRWWDGRSWTSHTSGR